MDVGRFAPSTTGPAHPGTLLSALLCWLDARARGGRVVLRLEDLDPQRCRPEWSRLMREALGWLGLDWDEVEEQHRARERHEAALDELASLGLLYPCRCTRATLRAAGEPAPDGGVRYPGTCRARELPGGGWREAPEALRVRLPGGRISLLDESGLELGGDPTRVFGDPVVWRRDGSPAYHLASVVDDAAAGVTRVVRGRDLAASALPQRALQRLLGLPEPRYRHHPLLLEERGAKFAKFHGAIGFDALRAAYEPEALCGFLAHAVSLRPEPTPVRPRELVSGFDWDDVEPADRLVRVKAGRLELGPPALDARR
ncbi:MAG: glutamate--tRNA ligase family protein [Proteobacteria bacterium]|nr:glutamate--tRNA ligase family protein [Pseudomonadota bacterium]